MGEGGGDSHLRKFNMVWLNRSPIPVGRRGIISTFKLFIPAFTTRKGRDEGIGILSDGDVSSSAQRDGPRPN